MSRTSLTAALALAADAMAYLSVVSRVQVIRGTILAGMAEMRGQGASVGFSHEPPMAKCMKNGLGNIQANRDNFQVSHLPQWCCNPSLAHSGRREVPTASRLQSCDFHQLGNKRCA